MSHLLYRLGRFCARRPFAVIGAWLVVSVLVIGASGAVGRELEDSFEAPGVDSQQATELLTVAGSDQAGLTAQLVLTPRDERATFFGSADERAALAEIQAGAAALPHVLGTSDPAGTLAAGPEVAVRRGEVSADGRVALIRIRYPVLEQLRADDLENLKAFGVQAAAGSPLRLEMGGDLFFAFEEPEAGTGELIGLVAAAVILLVAFGSVIAMGLPIAIALFGLALGISSMALVTYLVDIPSWAPELASMVGLGVGIDYALFLITRHRDHLARGMPVEESVGRAVETAGQVIVFAGGTVVIAILGLAVAGVPMMTAAGIAIATIVLIMVVASITLLPAFLGLAGAWINRLGFRRIQARSGATDGSRWRRWGEHVSGHAWAYVVGATVLLVVLAAPVFALRMGTPDEGALPETRTERRAYDLTAAAFGPGSQRPADHRGRHRARSGASSNRSAPRSAPTRASRRSLPARWTPQPASPRWWRSRRRDRRTAQRATRSRACATTCSRASSARVRHGPTSAGRPRASPTSATGSATACRCSSPRWSCCRWCCWS